MTGSISHDHHVAAATVVDDDTTWTDPDPVDDGSRTGAAQFPADQAPDADGLFTIETLADPAFPMLNRLPGDAARTNSPPDTASASIAAAALAVPMAGPTPDDVPVASGDIHVVRAANPSLDGGSTEIAFIDTSVPDYQTLADDVRPGVEVVEVSGSDGLEQIAAYLNGRTGIAAIHIFSHGNAGVLVFGGEDVSAGTIAAYQATLAAIGQSFGPNGDLLLYGCAIAADGDGRALVGQIAAYTHANVAASTDLTGAASLGGNWDLEFDVGAIDAATAINATSGANYQSVLSTYPLTNANIQTSSFSTPTVTATYQDLTIKETDDEGSNSADLPSIYSSPTYGIRGSGDYSFATETLDFTKTNHATFPVYALDVFGGNGTTYLGSYTSAVNGTNGYDIVISGFNAAGVQVATTTVHITAQATASVHVDLSSITAFQNISDLRVAAEGNVYVKNLVTNPAGPTVNSITRYTDSAAPTNATTVMFTVAFSGAVAGVSAANFSLAATGTASGAITGVSSNSSGNVWTVTVSGVTGNGSLGLNLSSVTGIHDSSGNALVGTHSSDQTYTVDQTAPVIANLNGDADLFVSGNGAVLVDQGSNATVTEANIASGGVLRIAIANDQAGEDVLALKTTAGGITTSVSDTVTVADNGVTIGTIAAAGNGAGGNPLTVTLASGDTAAEVADLLRAVTYADTAATPITAARSVQVTLTDAAGNVSATSTATVTLDQRPVVTAGHSTAIVRTQPATPFDSALAVTDPDANWNGGTLAFQITANAAGSDTLSLPTTTQSGIWLSGLALMNGATQIGTASAATATGGTAWTFTFNGAATNAGVTALAQAIKIAVAAGASLATRTITITAADNDAITAVGTDTVTLRAEPAITGGTAHAVSDAATTTPLTGITLTDGTTEGLTLSIAFTAAYGGFANATGWSATTTAGTTTLVQDFTTATSAASALATLTFTPLAHAGAVGTTQGVSFAVTATGDTTGLIATDAAASATITYANTTPTLTAGGAAAAYTAGAAAVTLDPGLLVTDPDNAGSGNWTGGSLLAHIQSGDDATHDVLSLAGTGITVSGTAVSYSGTQIGTIQVGQTGSPGTDLKIVFNSSATDAAVQALARALQFGGSGNTTSATDRAIQLTLADGSAAMALVTETVHVALGQSVTSINRAAGGPSGLTNATSLSFAVTFSGAVTGVTAANFSLAATGTASGTIVGIAGSGAAYTVILSGVAGDGSLGLNLSSTTGIQDSNGNPLTGTHVSDQTYSLDHTAPLIANLNGDADLFVSGNGAVVVDQGSNATITEANIASGGVLKIVIANDQAGEDVLALKTTAGGITTSGSGTVTVADNGVTIGTIAAATNGTGGNPLTVTLSAGDTAAQVADLIRAVTYADTAATPITTARSVQVTLTDAAGNVSATSTATVTLDQPPVVTAGHSTAIVRTQAATPFDSALAVTDPDANWNGGTLAFQITANAAGSDTLSLPTTTQSGIWLSGLALMNGATQIGTASAATATGGTAWTFTFNGAATNAGVTALAQATKIAVAAGASLATRTITITAADSNAITAVGTDSVTLRAEPAITGGTAHAVSDAATTSPLTGITLTDGTTEGLTLSIAFSAATGSFANATGWTATTTAGTTTLLQDFSATTAAASALAALSFTPTAHAGAVGTTQGVTFTVTATGDTTGLIATDVAASATITYANTTPTLTAGGAAAAYTAGAAAVTLDPGLLVTDPDNAGSGNWTGGSLLAHIQSGDDATHDVLSLAGTGITVSGTAVSYSGTQIGTIQVGQTGSPGSDLKIVFNSSATDAAVQALARALQFGGSGNTTSATDRAIQLTLADGSAAMALVTETVHVALGQSVTSINRATGGPAGLTNAATLSFAVTFSGAVTGVTAANFSLAATGTASGTIAGVSGSGTAWTVTVSGVAGDGSLGLNLSSITGIQDSNGNPLTGTHVSDQTYSLDHTAPLIANLNGDADLFVTGNGAVVVDQGSNATITEANIASGGVLKIVIANDQAGEDVLALKTTAGGITTSGSGTVTVADNGVTIGTIAAATNGTGGNPLTVTLSAGDTAAQVADLIRAITYADTAATPITTARSVQVTLTDAAGNVSATSTATVSLDQPPVVTAGHSTAIVRTQPATPFDSALAVTDPDANWNGGTLAFQITANAAGSDTLSLPTTTQSGIWLSRLALMNGATQIASASAATATGGTAWTFTFNGAATNAGVTALAQAIKIAVAAGASLATRTITVTAADNDAITAVGTDSVTLRAEPAITGGTAHAVSDAATTTPLTGITLTDGTTEGLTLSIAFTAATGGFANATGWSATTTAGTTTLLQDFSATTAAASALAALTYTPLAHAGVVGTTQAVSFTVTATGDTTGLIATDTAAAASITYANTAPSFLAPSPNIVIVEGTGPLDLHSLLTASDPDSGQNETWSQSSPPSEGTLVLDPATALSGGTALTPPGTATYTPAAGYTGTDSFAIQVSDGIATAVETITVRVAAPPVVTRIIATADTGTSNSDGITSNTRPTLQGTAQPNAALTLHAGTTLLGSVTADATGNWRFTPTIRLSQGSYVMTATDTSLLVTSPGLTIQIDTTIPTVTGLTSATDTGASTSDGVTRDATPTLTGTALANAALTIFAGGVAIGTTQAAADGSWQLTPSSALPDGIYPITATDVAGNTTPAAVAFVLTVDTTAPPVPSPVALVAGSDSGTVGDGITNSADPTLTGTAEPGSLVTLTDLIGSVSQKLGTTTAGSNGVWQFTPGTALAAGPHAITAVATDAAGNSSTASAPFSLTIVTAAPGAPGGVALAAASDSGAQGDGITDVSMPTLTGTAAPGSVVTVTDTVSGAATILGTASTDATGAWQFTPAAPLADGAHSFVATATDAAGNISAPSTALAVTIDSLAPAAPGAIALVAAADTGKPGDGITAVANPTLNGVAEPGSTINVFDTIGGTTTVIGSAIAAADGSWAVTPAIALANGTHTITATATDLAGNNSAASAPFSLTIQSATPVAPGGVALAAASDSGARGDGITDVSMPTLTGTAAPGSVVTVTDTVSGAATILGTASTDATGAWQFTPAAPLADGAHSFVATATDAAGNISAPSTALAVTIDSLAPAAPGAIALVAAADTGKLGDGITAVANPTLNGVAEPGSTVNVFDTIGGTTTVIGSAIAAADGSWAVTPAIALSAGTHAITATATDVAGNISATSSPFALIIDTGVPATPSGPTLAAAADSGVIGDGITNAATPTLIGTAQPGDLVTLTDTVGGVSVVLGSVTVGANGSWQIAPATKLTDGLHAITAVATDDAGLRSPASNSLALTIDTTAPAATTLTQTNSRGLVGSAEANATVTFVSGGIVVGTTRAGADGSWQFLPSVLAAGNYVLGARVTDAAANSSAPSPSLNLVVAADGSFIVSTTADGVTTLQSYDAHDVLLSTTTTSPQSSGADTAGVTFVQQTDASGGLVSATTIGTSGQVLQAVTPASTVRNIYDSAGTLIGTVREAGSATGVAPADWVTAPQDGGAVSGSDTTGSFVTLISGNNLFSAHGSDTISAGSGSDTITAPNGAVTVAGGSGSLIFLGGTGASTVSGGAGSSTILGGAGGGVFQGGAGGANLLVAGAGSTTMIGGGSGNLMFGGSLASLIVGASQGSDTVVSGAGDNTIIAQGGDVVFATTGNSTVYGSSSGSDSVIGGGQGLLVAGAGDDALFGGGGSDTMFAGAGSDTFAGGDGSALMIGGADNALFIGGAGISTVFGGAGNDVIWTGAGKMVATEGNGADQIVLGSGAAVIYGGTGQDIYNALSGAAGGTSTINGFKVGVDRIDVFGYASNASQATSGGSTTLTLADGTAITLVGVGSLAGNSVVYG